MKTPSLTKKTSVARASENIAQGDLLLPKHTAGLVILSQDKHNSLIAEILHKHKLGTLTSDFLADSDFQAAKLFEEESLCASQSPETANLALGYLASCVDASAVLIAASHQPDLVKAVVIRGGKPDDALDFLPLIKAPVLLIAGGRDAAGLRSAHKALGKLNGTSTLNVIPRASATFEETGTMEEAAQLAALWFLRHLEK